MSHEIGNLLANPGFIDALTWFRLPDAASPSRVGIVLTDLRISRPLRQRALHDFGFWAILGNARWQRWTHLAPLATTNPQLTGRIEPSRVRIPLSPPECILSDPDT